MNIIYPALPGSRKIDPFWEKESQAAEAVGFGISIVTDPNERGPVTMSNAKADSYLYRGWIVKPTYYQELSEVCSAVGGKLLISSEHYNWTFNFPQWFHAFTNHETPKSLMFTGDEIGKLGLTELAEQVSKRLGSQPVMIKDWLKSRKHEWFDACFIKDVSDTTETIRVMKNFFNLQGRDFYGGLVFREFLSLKKLGKHPISGMPIPVEFRTFFLKQQPMTTCMYWDNDVKYPKDIESPPQEWLEEIGMKMRSPFTALDIAQTEDGKWWVIEVNDGGTAGYPEHLDSKEFYGLLYQSLCP